MFDFIAESFDLERTNDYILSIQITLDGFSFSVMSQHENNIIACHCTQLRISSNNLIMPHFDEWIKKNEILQKRFLKTFIIYFSTEFSIIPEDHYSEQLVHFVTNRMISESELKYNEIHSLEGLNSAARIVFYLPVNMKEMIAQFFPSAEIIHPVQLMIRHFPTGNKKNRVVLLYHNKSFLLVAAREEQIIFANGFNINHINDLVYFVLNTLLQLKLNLKETNLYLSEALSEIENIEEILRPYFPELSHLPQIEKIEMVKYSIHRYYSVY